MYCTNIFTCDIITFPEYKGHVLLDDFHGGVNAVTYNEMEITDEVGKVTVQVVVDL